MISASDPIRTSTIQDNLLSFAAALFYFAVPAALIGIAFRYPSVRPRVASVIGALTPILLYFIAFSIVYLFANLGPEDTWAFHAMWLMSFFAYVICVALGSVLAFIKWPAAVRERYAVAVISTLVVATGAWIEAVAVSHNIQ